MSLTGELWAVQGEQDKRNVGLVKMPEGKRVTYDELLAGADPNIAKVANIETYNRRVENIQSGLDELKQRFTHADPDVVVMIGDDQSEFFFDDNMPSINVFWGKEIKMLPRVIRDGMSEAQKVSARAYGDKERTYPVEAGLGLHVIESLMDQDFDVSQSQYTKETYGGSIGPATWYLDSKYTTAERPFGLPHAFSFAIARWWNGKSPPILPITINTCYPPNWISARRAFALGQAVRRAVDAWDSDKTVAFATTGGLSHFVVDEELDRLALKGLTEGNGELLTALPRHRLQSATTEILNWVAVAGAMGDTRMETIVYEPGYRSAAGTGCGCAVGAWQ